MSRLAERARDLLFRASLAGVVAGLEAVAWVSERLEKRLGARSDG